MTEKPLDCRSLAKEAEMIPFPNDEVTPPVTNMYLDLPISCLYLRDTKVAYYA